MQVLRLWLLGVVVAALGFGRARAQPAPAVSLASQYVNAGIAAQNAGDYDTAITFYAKAYQVTPHPLLIFDMAQAHRLAGDTEQALRLYARYLAADPDGAKAQVARELVAELQTRRVAGTYQADAVESGAVPSGGDVPGPVGASQEPAQPGPAIGLGVPAPPTSSTRAAPSNSPVMTMNVDHAAARSTGGLTMRRKAAIGVAAAGVIGTVTGVVIGESAKERQHDAFQRCPDPAAPCTQAHEADALLESGQRRALAANVAFGVAALAAIAAGVLWFTGAPDVDSVIHVSIVPSLVPSEPGINVMGRF